MGTRNTQGLAALCLMANSFKADTFARDRMKDGRITHIVHTYEDGQDVVRVFSGIVPSHYTTGRSKLEESDARAQALQAFLDHEQAEALKRPGDLVVLEVPPCS